MIKSRRKYPLGVHTSISGGISKSVERAASLKCTTMQIFSHNPRQWKKYKIDIDEAERFKLFRKRYDINPVFIHASYLINMAARSSTVLNKSIDFLSYEMEMAETLGAEYVILHTGSASGDKDERARRRAAKSIIKAMGKNRFSSLLVLENTSGERGDIASSVKALAEIIDNCNCENIAGICIDTCHAFTAGYDLTAKRGVDQLILEIEKYAGLDKLKLLHLNDSKKPLGSGIDRHEHIGKGFIGLKGFRTLLADIRLKDIPLILETPKKADNDDKINLRKIRNILKNGK
jgi:deoxyribonuclease-4